MAVHESHAKGGFSCALICTRWAQNTRLQVRVITLSLPVHSPLVVTVFSVDEEYPVVGSVRYSLMKGYKKYFGMSGKKNSLKNQLNIHRNSHPAQTANLDCDRLSEPTCSTPSSCRKKQRNEGQ
jgi:hypothetical protein